MKSLIFSGRKPPSSPPESSSTAVEQALRVEQLATLNSILTQLTGTLSPDKVLTTVIESAPKISPGVTATAVYLYWDDQKSTLALFRSGGMSDRFFSDPPDPAIAFNSRKQALTDTKPLIVNDLAQWALTIDGDAHAAHLRAMMMHENKRAWIELPLAVGGVGLGVMVLYYDLPTAFSPEQVEILRTFATQVAQAISNARLYAITDEALERRVGQLLALAVIGHELTATIDLDRICTLVLNHALDATGAKIGALVLLNESGSGVDRLITQGYAADTFANPARALTGITRRVISTGKAVLARNALTEPDLALIHPYTRSQLSVPILRAGQVMGAMTLESETVNAFNDEDTHFALQLGNQAVISMDNARMLTRITETRDRLQVILNAMKEALVMIDRDGQVALANPAVARLGLTPGALQDCPIEDLLESNELDLAHRFGFASENEIRRIVKELRASGASWTDRPASVYTLESESGTIRIQRRVIAVPGSDGQPIGALLVFYDETEQYKLEQTREELSRMLVHDLRSPLTAVTTSLKLLSEFVPPDAPFRPAVDSTTDSARRAIRKLLSRVDSLLDVSRMESGFLSLDAKSTSLLPLVENVSTEIEPLARELNIAIATENLERASSLMIDADKVERVILNLVDNALKFSPLDSKVTIRVGIDSVRVPHGFVRVDVCDSGPGVPDEFKSRLFDRFVQVTGRTGSRRGSGLGLTFCRLVVEAHGGRIWIEDNPGGGSVFSFTLPIAQLA